MSPAAVIGLLTAIANAFGLAAEAVVAFAKQKHPELRRDPIDGPRDEVEAARAEAVLRTCPHCGLGVA